MRPALHAFLVNGRFGDPGAVIEKVRIRLQTERTHRRLVAVAPLTAGRARRTEKSGDAAVAAPMQMPHEFGAGAGIVEHDRVVKRFREAYD